MRAKLKHIHCPDLDEFNKQSVKNCSREMLFVQAFIGPNNEEGEESFNIEFCTPYWILNEVNQNKFKICRSLIVINKLDYDAIYKIINDFCNRTSGKNWNEIAEKISRFFKSELENY